ncbi:MAG: glycosyltransferase [Chloroflexi bacterium]|nr:glycosyltransferase [Chloroflexota bacterium]
MSNSRIMRLPAAVPGKTGWPWIEEAPFLPETMPNGMPWPRISVVTPTYNQGHFIEETIRSILLQGYPNLEYIIMDGGSTDNTVEIIKKYEPWLTYWVSEKDRGQSHAINKGWAMSTGEIIAYFNSDDMYSPGAFEKAAITLSGDPSLSAVVGRINYVDISSRHLATSVLPYAPIDGPCDLTLFDPDLWFLPQPGSFWARAALEKAGLYVRENLHYTMDRELFYRTCKVGRIAPFDGALASFRNHGQNKSIALVTEMYQEDAVALKYMDDGVFLHRLIRWRNARWWRARGYYFLAHQNNNGNNKKTVGYLLLAAFYRPAHLWRKKFYRKLLLSLLPVKLLRMFQKRVAA